MQRFGRDDYVIFAQHTNEKSAAAQEILKHITDAAATTRPFRILDVGCGSGEVLVYLAQELRHITSVDATLIEPDEALLVSARNRLLQTGVDSPTTIQKYIEQAMPYQDFCATFDLVMALHVLYYVPDLYNALRKLRWATRSGGRLCICLRHSSDDIYLVRSAFRKYYGHTEQGPVTLDDVSRALQSQSVSFTISLVESRLAFPAEAFRALQVNPTDPRTLQTNVAAIITRFVGHARTQQIPEDLLNEIAKLYRTRMHGDMISLRMVDGYIWVT